MSDSTWGRSPAQILDEIQELQLQLNTIQDECSHPIPCVTKVPMSDTGNWDRSQDSYWNDCICSLCGKHWREDQ